MPYVRLLRRNPQYRWVFLGNVMAEMGNWCELTRGFGRSQSKKKKRFNFVATISVLQTLTGSALAVTWYTVRSRRPSRSLLSSVFS